MDAWVELGVVRHSKLFIHSLFSLLIENVLWAVDGDPGSGGGLPVPVLHRPARSPSTSQRVGRGHEEAGPGHGEAAPGSLPLTGPELPEAVRAGPLLQPQEGDGGAGGRRMLELGKGCFPFHLYWGAGQTDAGAEEHKTGAGAWTQQGSGRDHSRLPGRGEERLAAGERRMGEWSHQSVRRQRPDQISVWVRPEVSGAQLTPP